MIANDAAVFATKKQRIAAWLVHLFTASGAVFGLITLYLIHQHEFWLAFWFMGAAVFVDAVDGTLARRAKTKEFAAKVDGALLDNIIDYLNYVIIPGFFLLVHPTILPDSWWGLLGASAMALSSAYQFTQDDAKTDDHYFKGFPSYWNIIIFYLYFWELSPIINLIIILTLSVLVFVPIKYIYPSRMEYLTPNRTLRNLMLFLSMVWGIAMVGLLIVYPNSFWDVSPTVYTFLTPIFAFISMGYTILYSAISLYRTLVPVDMAVFENAN